VRRYSLDESYFDNIDTLEQAYWLGFIAADGSIVDNERNHALEITLQADDRNHLLKFADCIGSNSPVTRDSHNGERIRIHSKYLIKSLADLGICSAKSLVVKPWDGPAYLMPAYWRGLFDGDGCIHVRSSKRVYWSIDLVGTHACVDGFRRWAQETCNSSAQPHPVGKVWRWAVSGTEKPQLLARALKDAFPSGLERKQMLLKKLSDIDFDMHRSRLNAARSARMHDAWISGRH
jgi:hypothetical protein